MDITIEDVRGLGYLRFDDLEMRIFPTHLVDVTMGDGGDYITLRVTRDDLRRLARTIHEECINCGIRY